MPPPTDEEQGELVYFTTTFREPAIEAPGDRWVRYTFNMLPEAPAGDAVFVWMEYNPSTMAWSVGGEMGIIPSQAEPYPFGAQEGIEFFDGKVRACLLKSQRFTVGQFSVSAVLDYPDGTTEFDKRPNNPISLSP